MDYWMTRYCRLLDFLMVVALAVMVVLVFGNVVLRYAFNSASPCPRSCRDGCSCG
jgi:TRAP-type C4-dicarboxylate transport system permease small subunit